MPRWAPPHGPLLHCAAVAGVATPGAADRPGPAGPPANAEYFRDCGRLAPQDLAHPRSQFTRLTPPHPALGPLTPVTVHYQRVDGPPAAEGRPGRALLLHGFGANTMSWHNVHAGLAELLGPCAALDMPGFGLTERPRHGADFRDDGAHPPRNPYTTFAIADLSAEFARRVLQGSADNKVVLVGHSLGSLIAALVAMRHPELVAGLVLICPALAPAAPLPPPAASPLSSVLAPLRCVAHAVRRGLGVALRPLRFLWARLCHALVVNPVTRWLLRRFIFAGRPGQGYGPTVFDLVLPKSVWADRPFSGRSRILEGYKRPIKARDFDRGVLEFTAAAMVHGNGAGQVDYPRLSGLRCLVIGGQNDAIVPPAACRRVAERLGCPYVELADAGHCPMEDQPEAVLRAIRQWLA
eukprot:EG_transcript_12400